MTDVLSGGDEMGRLVRSLDWAATPIGPVEGWPQSLRTAVRICLSSRVPMLLWWGPELVMLYNDACRPILGVTRHPGALGQRGRELWPELWEAIGPMLDGVLASGTAAWSDDQQLLLDRNGYPEECYFSFSYSPIEDEAGGVGGVFCTITETTHRVVGERRLRALRELARHAPAVQSTAGACQLALAALACASADIPFAALYLTERDGRSARLAGATGHAPALPSDVALDAVGTGASLDWLLAEALQQGRPVLIDDLLSRWPQLAEAPWPAPPRTGLVLPVAVSEHEAPAALLVTISPRRTLDEEYRGFLELVAAQIASGLAAARMVEAERQRAEAHTVREQLEQILEGIKDDFVMYDDEWRYVYVNEQAARSLGYPKEQLIGQRIWDLFPQAVGNPFYQEMLGAKAAGREVVFEHYYAPWGKWIENRGYPTPGGMLLFAADITERKQIEAALRESEARFRHMADHAPVMVWVTAPDGTCIYLSKSWYAFTGQTPEQGLGFGWALAVHPDDRAAAEQTFAQANERRAAFELEYQLRRSDGLYRWMIDSAVPRFGDDGTFLGYIGSVIDITERKQAELERLKFYEAERAARAAAERAARERDELLAYIAHDLKNPLTALLGATQLLQRRLRTPAALDVERLQRGLGTIEQTAARLAAQLNELQDVASLQAGQPLELQWHSIDLVALVERVVSIRQAATEQHKIRLETSLTELPCICDPFRIERVVSNLLGNAVKYSPQGGEISVRITREMDDAGEGVIIGVDDQGMGVPASDLPHIFERFYRGQNVDGQSGTGLGLASAQAIIQQHGGEVSIASELGVGTVVTVRLPLRPAGTPPRADSVVADAER
jgi:PAS domain S-box-containing protein